MKKRILAFMMAAAMVFGSATAVMAAGEGQSSAADTMTVTIKKNYQVNGAYGAKSPAETFRFADAGAMGPSSEMSSGVIWVRVVS